MLYCSPLQRSHAINFGRQNLRNFNLKKQQTNMKWCATPKMQQPRRTDQNLLSLSLRFCSDTPFYESPGKASFDQYLEDKPRLFIAAFPGTSQRLNEEEWRVEMPQIQVLFINFWPVIEMKATCKASGEDYPPNIPHRVTKVLELEMTNWEINGIHGDYRPSSVTVGTKGAIYSEKTAATPTPSRLKFQLLFNLSFVTPKALAFVPTNVLRSLVETVLKGMIENIKHKAMDRLVEDYSEFRKEKKKK